MDHLSIGLLLHILVLPFCICIGTENSLLQSRLPWSDTISVILDIPATRNWISPLTFSVPVVRIALKQLARDPSIVYDNYAYARCFAGGTLQRHNSARSHLHHFHHTNRPTFSACSIPVTDSTQRRRPLITMDEKYQRREGMMSLKRPTLAVEAMLDF